jgi:hypothetical protein
MSTTDFLPRREPELVVWVNNFHARLIAGGPGGAYGISAPTIASFTTLFNTWNTAYAAANSGPTRGPVSIETKNTAKANLIDGPNGIRELVGIIQHNPAVTNTQREELFITVPDVEPSPVPAPATAPIVTIKSTVGRTVNIRLGNAEVEGGRGKPFGVIGAQILTFVGEEAPAELSQWSSWGLTGKSAVPVVFPASVPTGAQVWITAYWFNSRKESGPASQPQTTNIASGLAEAA